MDIFYRPDFSKDTTFKWLIIVFSAVIAVVSFENFYYQYNSPKWAVFDVFCLFLFFYATLFLTSKKLGVIGLITFLITTCMFVSVFWSPNKFEAILFTCRFAAFSLAAFIMTSEFSKETLLKVLTDSVLYSSVVFCIVLLYQRYWVEIPYSNANFSPIGFVNYFGQVLNIWLPILAFSIYSNRKAKGFLFIGLTSFVILMNLLIESNTRGTMLGLLIGEMCVLLIILIKTKKIPLKHLSILGTFLLAIGSFSFFESSGGGRIGLQVQSVMELNTGREHIFFNTLDMIKSNPLGVGAGNFEYIHQKYAKAGTESASPYISELRVLKSPYNILLKFYSELGFIGGTLFLIVFGFVFLQALLNFLKGDSVDAWLFIAVFSLYFHSMFSSVFLTPVSLFFSILLFSLVLARSQICCSYFNLFEINYRYIFIPMIVVLGYLSYSKIASDNVAYIGYSSGDAEKVKSAFEKNPYNHFAAKWLSHIYMLKENDKASGLRSLERAIEVYPYNLYFLINAAEVAEMLGEADKAEKYKLRALEIYPKHPRAMLVNSRIETRI